MSTDDNLDKIISYLWNVNPETGALSDIEEAKASINKEALRIALEIIGKPRPETSNIYSSRRLREINGFNATNELIAKYRKAFEDRYKNE